MPEILPSLFAANIMNLQQTCKDLEAEGFKKLHVDMMDGQFVPHIAFGTEQIKHVKQAVNMELDVHLMVEEPEQKITELIEIGVEMISVHMESTPHIRFVLEEIKKSGRKAGVVLNPGTDTTLIKPLLNTVDYVLLMSINPGRPNQKFIEETIDRIKEVKELIGARNIDIEVDGSVNDTIAKKCIGTGASMIVIGSYLFADNQKNFTQLKRLEEEKELN
ncbi:ribulose-phosphate 3-epimerase [Oceanobacillus sp. CFH 90083]|uniref:ribulose-phosphate 3-epimerase n=1 Tax=Oceanobacillus sp. CFH 90083 TaxID=2592336 RepID=UPI00128D5882|nr:ribulose-phosphate 3-epimerase [Oceanobacillus sp. CFH 90083]